MGIEDHTHTPGPAAMPSVLLDDITLVYQGEPLFNHLTLTVAGGLCTCILGPSGCGKSTLLKIISGNQSIPFQGRIRFDPIPHGENSTAWMSQNDLLLPWLSVTENVLLGAKLRFEVNPDLRMTAARLIADAGLEAYSTQLPSALSGGMRQRVALLRTLMEDRPVLLMDEPFSALDALTRIKLQQLAAQLTKGKTVILVTHDPLEALRLGDHILVLRGSPVEVAASFTPEGVPPRDAGSTIVQEHYPLLLKALMEQ